MMTLRFQKGIIFIFWGLLFSCGVLLYRLLSSPQYFPVEVIRIAGPFVEVKQEQVKTLLDGHFAGSFFTVSLERMEKAFLSLPWVRDVSISRQWPDAMRITFREKEVVAHWGQKGFLTSMGEVFYPLKYERSDRWPDLSGPSGQEKVVWSHYQAMNQALKPLGLELKSLVLSERHSWTARLRTGQTLYFGKNRLFSRLARFRILFKKDLREKVSHVAYVDLRYPNGIAVGWKTGERC